MLRFKPGVSIKKITPQAVVLLLVAHEEFSRFGVDCWVTSGDDSTHREGSEHYDGNALDFRTLHLDDSMAATPAALEKYKRDLAQRIQNRLPADYHVGFEPTIKGQRTEHIHGEYRG